MNICFQQTKFYNKMHINIIFIMVLQPKNRNNFIITLYTILSVHVLTELFNLAFFLFVFFFNFKILTNKNIH